MGGNDFRELRLDVERTARVCLYGGSEAVGEIWYVLHGYGQSPRRFLTPFAPVVSDDRLLVAPEALSRFYLPDPESGLLHGNVVGASWMTREDREVEIQDYVRYLNCVAASIEADMAPAHRQVLGFSQGAHTAARWAALGKVRFAHIVLWGGGFPDDLPEDASSRLGSVRVTLVRGAKDGYRRPEEEHRDEQWLTRNGIAYEVLDHPGGHEISGDVLERLQE